MYILKNGHTRSRPVDMENRPGKLHKSEKTIPTWTLCGVSDIAGRAPYSYRFKRGMN